MPSEAISEEQPCPKCNGAGYLRPDVGIDDPDFGKLVPCLDCVPAREQERLARKVAAISAKCGLEEAMRQMTFDSFECYVGNEKAYHAARRFAAKGIDRSPGQWLMIRGAECGTGKTHLLAAIANDAIARGIPTFYAYTTALLDHLRAGMNCPRGEGFGNFEERFERVSKVRLFLLDDFGVQVGTEWEKERMLALMDARLRGGLPTALTTNLTPEAFKDLSYRLADRWDRYQPAEIVQMLAISYRQWRRNKEALDR